MDLLVATLVEWFARDKCFRGFVFVGVMAPIASLTCFQARPKRKQFIPAKDDRI
jgi:hypothetical protein